MGLYFETESVDPAYNLAFEDYLLTHWKQDDVVMLWQNDNTIVVGQNQNTYAEVNMDFVRAKDIRVVRRSTGGGAVYHDLGNLNYSFITDYKGEGSLDISAFTAPVVNALKKLGLDAQASGRNDILVSGKKVSGTAQRIVGGRILHHGTLLFESDPDMIAGALNVDPEKFRSKASKSVKSRVGNIRGFLPLDMDITAFWDFLKKEFADTGTVRKELSEQEQEQVKKLRDDKYSTWEWTYGRSPAYDMVNRRYFDGGLIEAHMKVKDGIIEDVVIYGDFLSVRSVEDVTGALRGCAHRRKDLAGVLSGFVMKEYFGSISIEEVLAVITGA